MPVHNIATSILMQHPSDSRKTKRWQHLLPLYIFIALFVALGLAALLSARAKSRHAAVPSSLPGSDTNMIRVILSPRDEIYMGLQDRVDKNCTDAMVHFQNALLGPLALADEARVWFWMGLCQYEMREPQAALASFEKSQTLDPTATSAAGWIEMASAAAKAK